jgi:hypothetical protein
MVNDAKVSFAEGEPCCFAERWQRRNFTTSPALLEIVSRLRRLRLKAKLPAFASRIACSDPCTLCPGMASSPAHSHCTVVDQDAATTTTRTEVTLRSPARRPRAWWHNRRRFVAPATATTAWRSGTIWSSMDDQTRDEDRGTASGTPERPISVSRKHGEKGKISGTTRRSKLRLIRGSLQSPRA